MLFKRKLYLQEKNTHFYIDRDYEAVLNMFEANYWTENEGDMFHTFQCFAQKVVMNPYIFLVLKLLRRNLKSAKTQMGR